MGDAGAPFDALYRASSDPWGTSKRWYEARKRALLMASLPHARYRSAYEAGCGTGHISVALGQRCDRVLSSDGSPKALEIAAVAIADTPNVRLARHRLPDEWPDGTFDLVVISELLYFLDDPACVEVARLARRAVEPGGVVVACDWRAVIESRGQDGETVHRRFEATLDLPKAFEYIDGDFILTGWSADTTSVAMREGLR